MTGVADRPRWAAQQARSSRAAEIGMARPAKAAPVPHLHVVPYQSPAATSVLAPLEMLFGRQPVENFPSDASVFWEGDSATHVFEVLEGVIRIVKLLHGGRRVITGFLYPGDLLGVTLEDPYAYSAEAVTPARLRRFARCHFDTALVQSPELRPYLFARLCDELAAAKCQMVLLARKTAEERVSSFLLNAARRVGRDRRSASVIEVPMNRLDVADYLGLTKETVSRAMCRLVSLGVIAIAGRHTVIIREYQTLAAHAGDGDEA